MKSILPLLAALFLSGCASVSQVVSTPCGLGPSTELPIRVVGRKMVVPLTVGDRTAAFILDTGAEQTSVTPKTATRLELLRVSGPPARTMGVGGTATTKYAMLQSAHVGKLAIEPQEILVIDGVDEIDGLLGLDVLSQFDLDIDLPKRRVTLYKGGVCKGQLPPMDGEITQINAVRPIIDTRARGDNFKPFLMIPVALDGATTFAMLDTGWEGTAVTVAFAEKAGVTREMLAPNREVKVKGVNGTQQTVLHRFDELAIGRELFENPMIQVVDGKLPVSFFLGDDYFARHRVWFNFAADRIFVVKAANP
jgi:predicted aspartyl protease